MRVGRRAGGGGEGRSRTIKSPRQALLVFLASDIGDYSLGSGLFLL